MLSKIKSLHVGRKSRYVAVVTVLAFVVASAASFVAPRKASAYISCNSTPQNCTWSINQCLASKPFLSTAIGAGHRKCTGAVQGFMNQFYGRNLRVDGDFGPATAWTVWWYQDLKNIGRDGKVGNQTWTTIWYDCLGRGALNNDPRICDSTYRYF